MVQDLSFSEGVKVFRSCKDECDCGEYQNKAHNVVPSSCTFVVDVRVTDAYTHEEILEIIQRNVNAGVKPRSMRMRSSRIDINHPLVQSVFG